jgi:hypothetical protein
MNRAFKPLSSLFLTALVCFGSSSAQACYSEDYGDYKIEFDLSGNPVLSVKVNGAYKVAPPDALKTTKRVKNGQSGQIKAEYEFTDSRNQRHTYEVADLASVASGRNPDTYVNGINVKNVAENKSVRYAMLPAVDSDGRSKLDASKKPIMKCQVAREYDTVAKIVTYDREFCNRILADEKNFESCKIIGDKIENEVKAANQRIEIDHKGLGYSLDFVPNPEHSKGVRKYFEQLMEAGKVCKSDRRNVRSDDTKPDPNVGLGGGTDSNVGL